MPDARTLLTALSVPWSAFVAAFLFYTALTLMAVGMDARSGMFMIVAYLFPAACYAAALAFRGVRALASLPIELWHAPDGVLR